MTESALFTNRSVSSFIAASGAKFFKVIMEPNKKRKLIGYFSSWDNLQTCRHTSQRWNDINVNWIRHSSPPPRSRVRQHINQSSKQSGTKVTGSNAIPLGQTSRSPTTKKGSYASVAKSSPSSKKSSNASRPSESGGPKSPANASRRQQSIQDLTLMFLDLIQKL